MRIVVTKSGNSCMNKESVVTQFRKLTSRKMTSVETESRNLRMNKESVVTQFRKLTSRKMTSVVTRCSLIPKN
jgi:hypothetical protein